MCRNGQYTERGIKQIDGFMSERWRIEPEYAMKVDPSLGLLGVLLEPTTVVTKAWEQVRLVGERAFWEPRTVLVTGAGPIGLLAALLGKQRGLEVHVLDRVESGPKPELVRALGATYHTGSVTDVGFEPDVIVECTGVGQVIADSIRAVAPGGIVCLTGVGSGGRTTGSPTADVARDDGAAEQRHRRQRQREQAALVQGRPGAGAGGPRVARAARSRGASRRRSSRARLQRTAGRHQGGRSSSRRREARPALVAAPRRSSGIPAFRRQSAAPMHALGRTLGRQEAS